MLIDMYKKAFFICGIGVCTSWGKSWERHWYGKKGYCHRCGIPREVVKLGY